MEWQLRERSCSLFLRQKSEFKWGEGTHQVSLRCMRMLTHKYTHKHKAPASLSPSLTSLLSSFTLSLCLISFFPCFFLPSSPPSLLFLNGSINLLVLHNAFYSDETVKVLLFIIAACSQLLINCRAFAKQWAETSLVISNDDLKKILHSYKRCAGIHQYYDLLKQTYQTHYYSTSGMGLCSFVMVLVSFYHSSDLKYWLRKNRKNCCLPFYNLNLIIISDKKNSYVLYVKY